MLDAPYSTAIQWLLDTRQASLVTASSTGKLRSLCRLFDQLALIEGQRAELGFELHNDGSDRVDFFARGGTEMLHLNGVDYPEWRDAIADQSKQQDLPGGTALFPPYYHLEFDEIDNGHRLAGIFQTCWPLRSLDASPALSAIATYLDKTNLYDNEALRRSNCLIDYINTFGPPCSIGIMDRQRNALKIAVQVNSISRFTLESFICAHFDGVFTKAEEQISTTVSAIKQYLDDGPVWINLDIDIDADKFFPRFSFELISPGDRPRKDYSSIFTCLSNYELTLKTLSAVEAATDKLPFGYTRKSMLSESIEKLYGWFNHAKISIQQDGVDCKSYFGLSYSES